MDFKKEFIALVEIDKADFDGYGHLRFSKYPWYFDLAREKFIAHYGLEIDDMIKRNLQFAVRLGGPVKHIKQLRVEGDVDILSRFGDYEGKLFIDIFQRMERGSECFATYRTRNVFVNLDTGGHVKPPEDLIKLIFG